MNRRQLFKYIGMISAGAVLPSATIAQPITRGKGLPLTIAGYDYDRVAALVDGRVGVRDCDLTFEKGNIGDLNTHVFSGPAMRHATEIGLHPFMLAYANGNFRDYTLLPVFPLRIFRHKSIFIRTDRGINRPEDLKGKKVATPGFSSTSITWIRGILQHEYGIKPTDVEWFVSETDSSAADVGERSEHEIMIPKNLKVQKGPKGKDESDMLADGDVDALFHAAEPRCYLEGNPKVSRLFPEFRSVEQAYYRKTGIFPIMHAVAMRRETIETYPWLPSALFDAYSEAKQHAYRQIQTLGWAFNSLPWLTQEMEDTRKLMGENFWPYGIEPNRSSLEALFQYSHEQGLASQLLKVEDLFHTSTLELTEA
jgi:4,5-dihydroxyphthalate decarboxylase